MGLLQLLRHMILGPVSSDVSCGDLLRAAVHVGQTKTYIFKTPFIPGEGHLRALTLARSQLRHLTAEVTPSHQNKDVWTDGADSEMNGETQLWLHFGYNCT